MFTDCFESINYDGNELSNMTTDSAESCGSFCGVNIDCAGFVYDVTTSSCSLKMELLNPVPNPDVISGPRRCGEKGKIKTH